jgi:molybdopterin-guanine dinucleotide biosynthesis protein A
MRLTAVLLVGGESQRMGRDKATLKWRGRFLWQWQIERLRGAGPEKIFLSARSDVSWRPADIKLVLDVSPSRGPLSGLAAALAATESDHLLALAVDMPFMTAEHLHTLCARVTNGTGVVPMIDGKPEPLCAIYPKAGEGLFQEALQSDDFSLQPVVRKLIDLSLLQVMPVSGSSREFYRSINEPRDLE